MGLRVYNFTNKIISNPKRLAMNGNIIHNENAAKYFGKNHQLPHTTSCCITKFSNVFGCMDFNYGNVQAGIII